MAEGSIDELRGGRPRRVTVLLDGPAPELPGCALVSQTAARAPSTRTTAPCPPLLRALADLQPRDVRIEEPGLDEVFRGLYDARADAVIARRLLAEHRVRLPLILLAVAAFGFALVGVFAAADDATRASSVSGNAAIAFRLLGLDPLAAWVSLGPDPSDLPGPLGALRGVDRACARWPASSRPARSR